MYIEIHNYCSCNAFSLRYLTNLPGVALRDVTQIMLTGIVFRDVTYKMLGPALRYVS